METLAQKTEFDNVCFATGGGSHYRDHQSGQDNNLVGTCGLHQSLDELLVAQEITQDLYGKVLVNYE
jgi:hypothetical protein